MQGSSRIFAVNIHRGSILRAVPRCLEPTTRHVDLSPYIETACQDTWSIRTMRNLALQDQLGDIDSSAKSP